MLQAEQMLHWIILKAGSTVVVMFLLPIALYLHAYNADFMKLFISLNFRQHQRSASTFIDVHICSACSGF